MRHNNPQNINIPTARSIRVRALTKPIFAQIFPPGIRLRSRQHSRALAALSVCLSLMEIDQYTHPCAHTLSLSHSLRVLWKNPELQRVQPDGGETCAQEKCTRASLWRADGAEIGRSLSPPSCARARVSKRDREKERERMSVEREKSCGECRRDRASRW